MRGSFSISGRDGSRVEEFLSLHCLSRRRRGADQCHSQFSGFEVQGLGFWFRGLSTSCRGRQGGWSGVKAWVLGFGVKGRSRFPAEQG